MPILVAYNSRAIALSLRRFKHVKGRARTVCAYGITGRKSVTRSALIVKDLARVTYTRDSPKDVVSIANGSRVTYVTASASWLVRVVACLQGIAARYVKQQITQGLSPTPCTGRNFPIQPVSSLAGYAGQIVKQAVAMLARPYASS